MSNPTRHQGASRSDREPGMEPRSTVMLQESTNPELFMNTSGPSLMDTLKSSLSRTGVRFGLILVVVAALIATIVVLVTSGGDDAQPEQKAAVQPTSTAPQLDPSKEVPGVMIEYRPDLPDGTSTPSQAIQSLARNFYSIRSTAGVMPYLAPGSQFTESFVENNIKNVQVGTRLTNLYMFPADADKLKNKKPLGSDPQAWLATAIFTLPDGKTYVDSMLFMTVKIDGKYLVQEFGSFTK